MGVPRGNETKPQQLGYYIEGMRGCRGGRANARRQSNDIITKVNARALQEGMIRIRVDTYSTQ